MLEGAGTATRTEPVGDARRQNRSYYHPRLSVRFGFQGKLARSPTRCLKRRVHLIRTNLAAEVAKLANISRRLRETLPWPKLSVSRGAEGRPHMKLSMNRVLITFLRVIAAIANAQTRPGTSK